MLSGTAVTSLDIANIDRAALVRAAGPLPHATSVILRYDTARYPFAAVLSRDAFKVKRLERLHDYLVRQREREGGRSRPLTHRDNLAMRALMEREWSGGVVAQLYQAFMSGVIATAVGSGISFTSRPKARVHLAGTPSVSSFHHDLCVTQRRDQINAWIPFVDVDGTATLWLESDYGCGDFTPVPVRYGEILVFDGGYLGHGSVDNRSDTTRVSIDLRLAYRQAAGRAEGVALLDHFTGLRTPQGEGGR